jgi:mono/diheme cytochrome c family protein
LLSSLTQLLKGFYQWLLLQRTFDGWTNRCIRQAAELYKRGNEIMKTIKLVMLVMTIAVALFILIPNLSWAAEDGAAIYKTKCAVCHGADATGKPAAKIPSLVSDEVKKTSDDDLAKAVTEKPKHPGMVKSLAPDQVKTVVSYVRSLQK